MKPELWMAPVVVGSLLATCLASGPAMATSFPVLKNYATSENLTLISERGGSQGGDGFAIDVGGGRHHGSHTYYDYGFPYYGYAPLWLYGFGLPYVEYGPYGGWCDWYYRNAIATGSSYWSDRFYEKCTGY